MTQWLQKLPPNAGRLAAVAAVVLVMFLGGMWLFGGEEEPAPRETSRKVSPEAMPSKTRLPGDDPGGLAPIPAPSGKTDAAPRPSIPLEIPQRQPEPAPVPKPRRVQGLTFLDAITTPLQSELDRFWGWRPNDLIEFTDNVNNFQLGVLEATRRTSIALAERISRSGSSDPYVPELERAMSLFAIDPRNWIFPRPESKYQDGLDNIRKFGEMLQRGEARFFNRMDNLVPLLLTYESLLGSSTENLLRRDVGFFQADDVFFYSQGVVVMVLSSLKGVGVDFRETIEAAQAFGVYSEIIVSLERMAEMDPPVILNSDPNSIFANHRANMAGLMSRCRFLIHILYGALTGDL
jgi:hypothetical protein